MSETIHIPFSLHPTDGLSDEYQIVSCRYGTHLALSLVGVLTLTRVSFINKLTQTTPKEIFSKIRSASSCA